ncbi:hypothetical protein BY996DRAFT_6455645 [Phakopsora pachyrhizi]|nr:hypothetical protein BY996DRAFT_6455645 [Phakopsora pachyrhizi]
MTQGNTERYLQDDSYNIKIENFEVDDEIKDWEEKEHYNNERRISKETIENTKK